MKTKLWAIATVICATLFTSSAQILYKKGADNLELTLLAILTNYPLILGFFLYVIAGFMIIFSFKGGEVSVLYPIIATSFIWVSFLSVHFLGEEMNVFKWLGVSAIVAGIIFIGFGSKSTPAEVAS